MSDIPESEQPEPEVAVEETAVVADPVVDPEQPAGVPHGTVLTSPEGHTERIMHNIDDAGNLVGWHKEPVEGGEGTG